MTFFQGASEITCRHMQ